MMSLTDANRAAAAIFSADIKQIVADEREQMAREREEYQREIAEARAEKDQAARELDEARLARIAELEAELERCREE